MLAIPFKCDKQGTPSTLFVSKTTPAGLAPKISEENNLLNRQLSQVAEYMGEKSFPSCVPRSCSLQWGPILCWGRVRTHESQCHGMLWAENRLLLAGGVERQRWSCCSSENRSAPAIGVSFAIKILSKGVNNLRIREILKIDSTLSPYQGNNLDK